MDAIARRRAAYAREVVARAGSTDAALIAAFATVPRERFAGAAPWHVSGGGVGGPLVTDDPVDLYRDALIRLSARRSINNGQPSLHAQCLAALALRGGETVVHVGAGGGYYTALIAQLVGPSGVVHAYEIESDLAAAAALALRAWPQVRVHERSGSDGALPVADAVYVSAGATHPADAWLDALAIGGRLLFPLTGEDDSGTMLLVHQLRPRVYAARTLLRVVFIGCAGVRDAASAAAVSQAMHAGRLQRVQSLRRDGPPDENACLAGRGWWLSRGSPPA